jgi:hypothetical protein
MANVGIEEALTRALMDYFADLVRDGGRSDLDGTRVSNVAPDGSAFDLEVTFLWGEVYCCDELGCHFPAWHGCVWRRLRDSLAARGHGDVPPMTIRKVTVVVEEGAQVFPVWEGQTPVDCEARTYEEGPYAEADAKQDERGERP